MAQAVPPGANDPACTPNSLLHPHRLGTPPDHPHTPVVLVHGTALNADSMTAFAVALKVAGYCPWADSYPTDMTNDGDAPNALKGFVDDVLDQTDAAEVSMVGHSQGGIDDMSCWAPIYGDADYTNITTVSDGAGVSLLACPHGPVPHPASCNRFAGLRHRPAGLVPGSPDGPRGHR